MKSIWTLAAISFLSLTLSAQEDKSSKEVSPGNNRSNRDASDVRTTELRDRAEDWKKAYNSNDAAKLGTFYTEDADCVSPHVPDLMIHGRDRIRENFQIGIAMGGHVDSVEVLRSGFSYDLAFVVSKYVATNSGVVVSGRNVLLMKKINGEWLIITHASVVRD